MKTCFSILLVILFVHTSAIGQTLNDDLIKLAKAYRNFSFKNDAPQTLTDQLNSISNPELQKSKKFIQEVIRKNNQLATAEFLFRPDSVTLKHIFTIRLINWNLFEADPKDNLKLIDSVNQSPASTYEQLAAYYGILFGSIGNKNQPLGMEKIDISLESYGLKDDTEKGILFLKGMELFGTMIWGYMNIVKPPNYDKALEVISHYPTFNGQSYYKFQDLNFQDFTITIDKKKGKESFKKYYINKYLNTLLYHSASLAQKKKNKKEKEEVMLGSIMSNESYYKYTENPEIFRQIFKRVEN